MPIQPGTLFASLLLFLCLGTNVVFYSNVRESFLGNRNVSPSEQAQTEPDVNVFYPETVSARTETPKLQPAKPAVKPEEPKPKPQESRVNLPIPPANESVIDPFLLPSSSGDISNTEPAQIQTTFAEAVPLAQPAIHAPVTAPAKKEVSTPTEKNAKQVSASIPFHAAPPKEAMSAPVYADQFKPVHVPALAAKSNPSSAVVWDNIESALERPIHYETAPKSSEPCTK
jgi:hypothetical protein